MTTTTQQTVVVVWGVGPAQARYIRAGEATARAREVAARHGFALGGDPDYWAVEVQADRETLDADTRHDPAVHGWAVAPLDQADLDAACREASGSGLGFVARLHRDGTVTVRRDEVYGRSIEQTFRDAAAALDYLTQMAADAALDDVLSRR